MHKTIVLFTRQCIYQGLLVFLFVNFGNAQNASPYIPSILPPSPNAAALMKFADIPVSKYTGAVDVSVPIYTITAKGLTLPINIDYHTGGIRLKEEASYVGLGWTLSCGGAISRTVMDKDDFNASDYFTSNVPQLQGDVSQDQFTQAGGAYPLTPYYIDFWCNYKVNFSTGTADYYNAFVANPTAYDLEPDIYSYNFAGKSGKFIITRSGTVILQKQDNLKIQFGSNSFTITDDEGNKYYFQDKEYATTAAMSWGPTSTWNLSKIITSLNDSIQFSYQTGTTTYLAPDQYEIYNANTHLNPGYITGSNSGVSYSNTAIKTVDFPDGEIQFSYNSSSRRDLQGALRLDSIKIYSKSSTGLTYVKGDNLFYSYFNDDATGQSNPYEYLRLRLDSVKETGQGLSSSPYSFQYLLPLNETYTKKHSYSVDHWGFCNGKGNTTFLPSIATLYSPPAGSVAYPYSYFTYSGADRSPDFNYMPAFTLNQVTYPTGGKSVFQYEENNYDQQKSITGPVDFPYSQLVTIDTLIQANTWGTTTGSINVSNIVPDNTPGESTTNLTLIVTFRATSDAALTTLKSTTPYGRISFTFNNSSYDFTNSANTCSGSVCSITVPLALIGGSNTIAWSSYIDQSVSSSNFTEIDARLQFQRVQTLVNQANNDYRVPSGGLRIKSITDYSNASTIAKQRVYQYEYTTNNNGTTTFYTYGRQMSMPSYVRYSRDIYYSGTNKTYDIGLSLFSSSINSLTSTVQGNIVGYDKVIEKTIDPSNNADNGETISTFYNLVDSACYYDGYRMPGILNMPNNLNGTLISQTDYVNSNGSYYPVSSDSNFYRTTNRQVYFSTKYNFPGQNTDTTNINSKCLYTMVASSEAIICLYPSLKSEKILLDSTVNYVYDLSGNYLRTSKKYFYDNPVHYQVTRTSTVDSKGNSLITHIRYPQDYLATGSSYTGNTTIDTMLSRNMVSETIEKQDSLYYSGSSAGYVTGSQLSLYRILTANSNTVIPDKVYKLDLQSPVTNFQPFSFSGNTLSMDSRYRQMISFDQYDSYNNIQQYTATDQNPVTAIWDYTNTYPIAQVKNAALADVAATSFEADGKGGWTFSGTPSNTGGAITGAQSYNLSSGSISKSGLTSGTKYILSYWSKGSVSISGGTQSNSITGKTINGWTYNELTVTGTSSLSLSGSTYIDELRLYPVTAQMTTYTYAPLVGMTTACDADNRITYYSYDALGRLDRVKDQDGNIIKTFQYHYQNLTAPN